MNSCCLMIQDSWGGGNGGGGGFVICYILFLRYCRYDWCKNKFVRDNIRGIFKIFDFGLV